MLPARKKLGLAMIEKGAKQKIMPDETSVDIKIEVYRTPQVILAGLAAYYDVKEQNSFRIVAELVRRNKLHARYARSFNEVLDVVAKRRTLAHLQQGREADILTGTPKANATQLADPEWQELLACKGDLYLIQQIALKFVEAKNCALKSNRTNPFAVA
jgi:hypothetical protein